MKQARQALEMFISGDTESAIALLEMYMQQDYIEPIAYQLFKLYIGVNRIDEAKHLAEIILLNTSSNKIDVVKDFLDRYFLVYEHTKNQSLELLEVKRNLLTKAISNRKQRNYEAAKEYLYMYCKLDEDATYKGYYELAYIAENEKDYDLAHQYLQRVKAISTSPKYYYLSGWLAFDEKDYLYALSCFETYNEKTISPCRSSYYGISLSHMALGNIEEAYDNILNALLLSMSDGVKTKKMEKVLLKLKLMSNS